MKAPSQHQQQHCELFAAFWPQSREFLLENLDVCVRTFPEYQGQNPVPALYYFAIFFKPGKTNLCYVVSNNILVVFPETVYLEDKRRASIRR